MLPVEMKMTRTAEGRPLEMKAKERVRMAMSGGIPDCVPVVPQICPPHAIRAAGLPFKETIVDWLRNPRKYDLAVAECAANYDVDGVRVWIGAGPATIEWDGDEAFQVSPKTGERKGIVDFMGGGWAQPLKSKQRRLTEADVEAIEVVPAEELLKREELVPAKQVVSRFGEDLFVIGVPRAFTVDSMFFIQGMEASLMDMIDRPEFIKRLTERQLEAAVQQGIAFAMAGVDALYVGEAFGQFMSPEQFCALCAPYFRAFVEQVRPHGPLIYLHMCGKVTHLLDQIADTGVDCIEPLDEVAGTRVAEVKKRIGDRVALMGGVNTLLLAHGTVEDVEVDCARCIREGAEGGGYILGACDMLPTETSAEKVEAMVQCAKTLGRYDGASDSKDLTRITDNKK